MPTKVLVGKAYVKQTQGAGLQGRTGYFEQRPDHYQGYRRRDGSVKHGLYDKRASYICGAGTQQAHNNKLVPPVEDSHPDSIKNYHRRDQNKYRDADNSGLLEKMGGAGNVIDGVSSFTRIASGIRLQGFLLRLVQEILDFLNPVGIFGLNSYVCRQWIIGLGNRRQQLWVVGGLLLIGF